MKFFATALMSLATYTISLAAANPSINQPLRHAHSHDTALEQNQRDLSPALGTSIRALVLLIRFTDHANRVLPNVTYYDDLCNNKIAPYLKQQSYGLYQSTCQVEDWFTTANTEAYYAQGKSGQITEPAIHEMFRPKLDALDALAGTGTDSLDFWGQFDSDRDGTIDSLFIFHSGYPAEFPGDDCETGATFVNRIFSGGYNGERVSGGWESADGNFGLSGFSITSGLTGTCNGNPCGMGIATHEHIHTYNAFRNTTKPVDLYDKTTNNVGGVGGYDIMSNPFGPLGKPDEYPGSMGPWSKLMTTWIDPITISSDGTYTASPSTTAPDYYKLVLGPADEFLVLEYRVPVSFDSNFYGSGLVIWHIDYQADGQNNRGYPGQSGWPQNGNHYRVAIAQKDGLYELEQGINIGDIGDIFVPGDSLGPNTDGNTYPNTDSYQGGNIVPSGITITIDSMDDSGLTFTISGLGSDGGAAATRSPIAAPSASISAPAPVPTPSTGSSPTDTANGADSTAGAPTGNSPAGVTSASFRRSGGFAGAALGGVMAFLLA
ncbi:hypothetical protein MPSEU_000269100 [Mayamaea pseudoterrestris]|nr:hypothetical protein MPSEU_000269100 [Mayamaea pseudoterrestris]